MIKHKFLVSTADMALMLSLHEDARYANMIAQREALVSMGADLMPFPNQVNVQPAPAVAGDFASTNPRSAFPAGPGGRPRAMRCWYPGQGWPGQDQHGGDQGVHPPGGQVIFHGID